MVDPLQKVKSCLGFTFGVGFTMMLSVNIAPVQVVLAVA